MKMIHDSVVIFEINIYMQAKSRDVNFVSKIKCYELIFSINKAVFIIYRTVVQLYNFTIFQCSAVILIFLIRAKNISLSEYCILCVILRQN